MISVTSRDNEFVDQEVWNLGLNGSEPVGGWSQREGGRKLSSYTRLQDVPFPPEQLFSCMFPLLL